MPMRIASDYEALAGEVLAAFAVCAEVQTGTHARNNPAFLEPTAINMNIVLDHSKRPRKSLTWSAHSRLVHWDRKVEAIVHPAGAALKRCFKHVQSGGRMVVEKRVMDALDVLLSLFDDREAETCCSLPQATNG
jgi:hypothetical protein